MMNFPKSKKNIDDAKRLIADNVSGMMMAQPAKGSKIVDLDGVEYTDYYLNGGANILGTPTAMPCSPLKNTPSAASVSVS
jgi:glutamate-1-semialdehyde aminotransferase